MTTTAASTSASPSTSNDSPMQDINGASELTTTIEHQQQQQQTQPPTTTTTPPPPTTTTTTTTNTTTTTTPPPQQQQQQQRQQQQQNPSQPQPQQQQQSSKQPQQQPANTEQKRPMNAFLLFCKKQRSSVREQYPNLENRGITKILGDWWSKLDKEQKRKYTDLAREHKEAFMKANPDFKWCKTPMSNNNNNSNTNSNSNDCYHATNNRHTDPIPPVHIDAVQSNTSRDTLLASRQLEAPKPPKKRFLERNDSVYTTKNNSTSIESAPHVKDGLVPYISLDKDTLDRVIDEAFSEKSNNSPSGINMCKSSNRISNLTPSAVSVTQSSFSTSSTPAYSTSVDEPVDFSMNKTISATRQQIINNLVEKMLSAPTDNASSTSKMNGTDSVQSQPGQPVRRESPEDT